MELSGGKHYPTRRENNMAKEINCACCGERVTKRKTTGIPCNALPGKRPEYYFRACHPCAEEYMKYEDVPNLSMPERMKLVAEKRK
jgi:hypothetical protein